MIPPDFSKLIEMIAHVSPELIWAIVGAVIGIILDRVLRKIEEKRKFKKELEDNNYIDVSGEDWYAAWQTSVEGSENINSEQVTIVQKGNTIRINNTERAKENPKGAYLWEGQMNFFQGRNVMGWYFPKREENNTSKGMMYFAYHSPSKVFYGRWVGCAYDGDFASGFAVISKDRAQSITLLNELVKTHPLKVNIIYYAFK